MPRNLHVNQDIAATLSSPLASIRDRRRFIEYEWLKNYAAWQGWPNSAYYANLADDSIRYSIPVLRRALERTASRILKVLTPRTDWFDVQPFDDISYTNAASVESYMRFVTRQNRMILPFRRNLSAAVRCICLYDFTAIKTSIAVDHEGNVWPSQRTVDPYSFYVYPETASNPGDCLLLFEDSIIPYEIYESFVDASLCEHISPSSLSKPIWPYHLLERFSYRGLTNPSDFAIGVSDSYTTRKNHIQAALENTSASFIDLTDLWIRKKGQWYNAWLINNMQGYSRENEGMASLRTRSVSGGTPYLARLATYELAPTYKWTTHRPLPSELYTNSLTDDIRVLQNLFNNQISQTEEARQMATTGPVVFNQTDKRTQQYRYRNREIWYVDGDVRESFARLNYEDTSPSGLRMAQVTLGLINSMAGAGTIAEGQPGRNMPRAGFAVNNLINLSLSDVQDIAETLEQDILTPSLMDIHAVSKLYIPSSQIIQIPGAQTFSELSKSDLTGRYLFEWVGSVEFQDREMKAERLMLFSRLLIDAFPILREAGYTIDFPQLVQQIYMNGIGIRGLHTILREMTPEEQKAAQLKSLQQQGGSGANGKAEGRAGRGSQYDDLLQRVQGAGSALGGV